MRPGLAPGTRVRVEACPAEAVARGDLVLYEREGSLWLHRCVGRTADGSLLTKGDGRAQADAPVPPAAVLGRSRPRWRFAARLAARASLLAGALGRALARLTRPADAIDLTLARFSARLRVAPPPLARTLATRLAPLTHESVRPPSFSLTLEVRDALGEPPPGEAGLRRRSSERWTLATGFAEATVDLARREGAARLAAERAELAALSVLRALAVLRVLGAGGLVLHASAALLAGRAHVFIGSSGAGKSTALRCLPGATVLAEDMVLLAPEPDSPAWRALGGPAWGAVRAPVPGEFEIAALWCLERGKPGSRPLSRGEAAARLLAAPAEMLSPEETGELLDRAAALAAAVPVRALAFSTDPGALARLLEETP